MSRLEKGRVAASGEGQSLLGGAHTDETAAAGIVDRVHRKLTQETAEVVGAVTVGSLTIIGIYEYAAVTGQLSGGVIMLAAGLGMTAAVAGEFAVRDIKKALQREKEGK